MRGIISFLGRGRLSVAPVGTDPRDEDAFTEISEGDVGLVLAENDLGKLHDPPGCPGCGEREIRGRVRGPGTTPYTVFECGHAAEMVPEWMLSFMQVQAARARRRAQATGIIHAHMSDLLLAVRRGRKALPAAALEPMFGPGYTNLHGPLADVQLNTMRSVPE
ncbi:hypothetical protein [Nonomuraea candida]|uniref:hypothetical protein n=1 Tax=Nonomuraea candida TaxID=359159 RepID=UPI0005BB7FF6|nr:hypothetical protein [Nonomuraea candida]